MTDAYDEKPFSDICILIPAFNPDSKLTGLVRALIREGFRHVIVVNDGSSEECRPVFEELRSIGQCHVLEHAVNLGKGRALKTGLNYFYITFPHALGIVTADADGQHLPSDIVNIALKLNVNRSSLVLGSRTFSKDIPFRSLFGNIVTRYVFMLLVGKKIIDTQSGLRGIPRQMVPLFIRLGGERYEYELNMLIATKIENISVIEEKISTVYLKGNESSHFNPLIDSLKIYFLFIKFVFSSLFSAFVDFVVFVIAYKFSSTVSFSIAVARLVSANVNLVVNKKIVFQNRSHIVLAMIKYYLLVIIMGTLATFLIEAAMNTLNMGVIAAKVLVETMLFVASFYMQREIVFKNKAYHETRKIDC